MFETRECCFADVHFYSDSLSAIAIISRSIMLELIPACFSCSNNFHLSQCIKGSDENHLFSIFFRFWTSGCEEDLFVSDPPMIAGDLGN